MYNPAHFVEDRPDVLRAFIENHPFAILTTCGPDGPEATHVPVVLHSDVGEKGVLRCHLARANQHWKMLVSSEPILAIFTGPQHYVTPKWYPSTAEHGKVVPTWNYVTVHARGTGRMMSDDELIIHLKSLTDRNEEPFEEPWTVEGAPAEFIAGLRRAIVGVEVQLTNLQGKWKASQNRPEPDRLGVIEGLKALKSPASLEMSEVVREAMRKASPR
jgi:transcriptional regulator